MCKQCYMLKINIKSVIYCVQKVDNNWGFKIHKHGVEPISDILVGNVMGCTTNGMYRVAANPRADHHCAD